MRSWAVALAVAAAPAAAQAPATQLDWMVGSWRGEGTMMGNPSQATLELRPALGGRFLELRYVAGRFEGRAFYRAVADGRWRAEWFDNRGVHFGIDGAVSSRTLTADWGSAETERGRTIYRLRDDGRLESIDSVVGADGTMREFARHVLERAN